MGNVLFGLVTAIGYLVIHAVYDWEKSRSTTVPPWPPIRKRLRQVPDSAVPEADREQQLRSARALMDDLAFHCTALWLEARIEAEQWLKAFDDMSSDRNTMLKQAYLLLLKIQTLHEAIPNPPMLDTVRAETVTTWIDRYVGAEGSDETR